MLLKLYLDLYVFKYVITFRDYLVRKCCSENVSFFIFLIFDNLKLMVKGKVSVKDATR